MDLTDCFDSTIDLWAMACTTSHLEHFVANRIATAELFMYIDERLQFLFFSPVFRLGFPDNLTARLTAQFNVSFVVLLLSSEEGCIIHYFFPAVILSIHYQ
jgi:hypothetical protein